MFIDVLFVKQIIADILSDEIFILLLQQKLQQHMKLHDPTQPRQIKVKCDFSYLTSVILHIFSMFT